jgi:tetratricopeptide (TPR) repeat protein
MATKKKASSSAGSKKEAAGKADAPATITPQQEAFEKLLAQFSEAIESFNKGDFAAAKTGFEAIVNSGSDEAVLLDRSRSYAQMCEQRLAPGDEEPGDSESRYYRAVLLINEGRGEEALRYLDQALQESPTSAKLLYTRASAWAIQGKVDKAVSDLRQAIAVDPQVRFQAVNDPDFEPIREEPAFIDIIEPTPTGV